MVALNRSIWVLWCLKAKRESGTQVINARQSCIHCCCETEITPAIGKYLLKGLAAMLTIVVYVTYSQVLLHIYKGLIQLAVTGADASCIYLESLFFTLPFLCTIEYTHTVLPNFHIVTSPTPRKRVI